MISDIVLEMSRCSSVHELDFVLDGCSGRSDLGPGVRVDLADDKGSEGPVLWAFKAQSPMPVVLRVPGPLAPGVTAPEATDGHRLGSQVHVLDAHRHSSNLTDTSQDFTFLGQFFCVCLGVFRSLFHTFTCQTLRWVYEKRALIF